MQIANLLPQKIVPILLLVVACMISALPLPQSDPPKDKAPLQEKKSDEKKPEANVKAALKSFPTPWALTLEPYMKRLKFTVQGHWNALIPAVALPPLSKSGTVTIELAVMKDGQCKRYEACEIIGRLAVGSGRWGGITDAIPLPTLPSEFKGDYLKLRCNFIYNPPAKQPAGSKTGDKTRSNEVSSTSGPFSPPPPSPVRSA